MRLCAWLQAGLFSYTITRFHNYPIKMTTSPNPASSPREFYRTALAEAFRHSGLLAARTGRRAEDIVDRPEFDSIVQQSAPYSLEAARRIGDMTVVHLNAAAAPWPWWKELLAYERACFLQAAATDQRLVTYMPRRGVAATTENFSWDMPQLLECIRSGQPDLDIARRNLTLLFSRPKDGKAYVTELEKPAAAVFRLTNAMRKKEQIAEAASMPLAEVDDILRALAEIGAVENI